MPPSDQGARSLGAVMGTALQRASSDLARHLRHHPHDAEGERELRRRLAETHIAETIKKVVAGAPPLTDEAKDRIRALLSDSA